MKNRPIIIIGAGGHSSVLIDILKLNNKTIVGLTDFDENNKKSIFSKYNFIGNDSKILEFKTSEIELVNGIGPSTKNFNRKNINEKFTKLGYSFAKIIHPSAVISNDSVIGAGSQIMSGAIIQPGVVVGKNSVINTKSSIDHNCHIHNNAHIAPGSTLCGNVTVYDDVYVGAGSVVVENLTLGEKSVLGAGITLRKNLENNEIYVGN